ncbi:MAG: hypothetical protein NZ740_10120 [Kiritimatiellae bacterium]|nr:hypothetical protein [Kiritimatiellia bacterium]MDW8459448.1 hypothetical protein [Verrucomicrobiota bacterium]
MSNEPPRLLVLYIPSLDRRRMDPDVTPYLSSLFSRRRVIELETVPTVEMLPTILTGQWPHEHKFWQVKLRPRRPRTWLQRAVDALPPRAVTAAQCVVHRFRPSFDLPTIEPRRRREFITYRVKQVRLAGSDVSTFDFLGAPTVFSALGGKGRYQILRTMKLGDQVLEAVSKDSYSLEILDLYALDILCHWNLDRPEVVREGYRRTDELVRRAHELAQQQKMRTILLVDHGQELVREYIDVPALLAESGVPEEEYCYYLEVVSARFWFFTPRAREAICRVLSTAKGADLLTNDDMARYHVAFRDEDGWGDVYLIAKPGFAFFPHDFYHPLVNAYMARKAPEHAARRYNPRHRGTHGHLPTSPSEIGLLVSLDDDLEAVADKGMIIDAAPTMLSLLGQPIPPTMRGRPLFRAS